MKIAAIIFVLLAVGLGIACYARGGMALVSDGLRAGVRGIGPLLPMLVVIVLLVGFIEVLLPRETVAKWLSDESGLRGLGVAWAAGVLTPGGGPIGLPIVAMLLRAGAGAGVLVTYLTSIALLSFVRIPLELGIYGLRLTLVRIASTAILPFLAGGLALLVTRAFSIGLR